MRRGTTLPSSAPFSPRAMQLGGGESPAGLIGTLLLGVVLLIGPALLGADRLWSDLPLLVVIAVLMIVQALRLTVPARGNALRQVDAIDLSIVCFLVYAVVRWLTSPTEFFSRIEIMNCIAYAAIFFFCRYGLTRRVYAEALIILVVVAGLAEVTFSYLLSHHSSLHDPGSLWLPFGPKDQLHIYFAPRWIGSFGNPNAYGCFLVMATGSALAVGAFSKFPWPLRIVFFYAAALLSVGILYSASRGSWLGLLGLVGALTTFGLRYGTLRWWVPVTSGLLLVASFGVVFALSPLVQDRVSEVTTGIRTGTLDRYARVELNRDALRIARDYPVFGTGPATFTFIHPRYQSPTLTVRAIYAHDDYLNTVDDYGLVGFALAMIFFWLVTLRLFHRVRADFRWQDRMLVAAGVTAWFALLVHSFFDYNLHIPANAMTFFTLVGIGLRRMPGENLPRHWSTVALAPLGRWLGWGLFGFALLYAFETGRTALADQIYEHAYDRAEVTPTLISIANVEQALTFDPGNTEALDLLGDLYRIRASRGKTPEERTEEGEKAVAAYQLALKANRLDDTIQAQLGLTFDIMRRYPEAFFCYKAAVTAQPENGQFWHALGTHFWRRDLLVQAEEAYLRADKCPHGGEGDADWARQVQVYLDAQGVPPPPPDADPLTPPPPAEEPPTTP